MDKWHEGYHPFYWSKDFDLEAELHDNTTYFHLKTELPAGANRNDYTNFTTYVCFDNPDDTKKNLLFDFEPRKDTGVYYVWVRARSSSKNTAKTSSVRFSIDGKTDFQIGGIEKAQFKWYCLTVSGKASFIWAAPDVTHELQVRAGDQYLELDRVLLSVKKIPDEVDKKELPANLPK